MIGRATLDQDVELEEKVTDLPTALESLLVHL